MGMKPKGGPFPDRAGCIGSYSLDGDAADTMTIGLPPGSYWWRAHRKRLKIYGEDVELGKNARADLKRIPEGFERIGISSIHEKKYSIYMVSWL